LALGEFGGAFVLAAIGGHSGVPSSASRWGKKYHNL
jgi:hypothetical protein